MKMYICVELKKAGDSLYSSVRDSTRIEKRELFFRFVVSDEGKKQECYRIPVKNVEKFITGCEKIFSDIRNENLIPEDRGEYEFSRFYMENMFIVDYLHITSERNFACFFCKCDDDFAISIGHGQNSYGDNYSLSKVCVNCLKEMIVCIKKLIKEEKESIISNCL